MVGKQSPDVTSRMSDPMQHRDRFQDALVRVMDRLVREAEGTSCDANAIHALALEVLCHALLGSEPRESVAMAAAIQAIEHTGLGPLDPEQVGRLYEFGRGFQPKIVSQSQMTLQSSATGKRNQGLFYTPLPIVRHIVDATLDAMCLSDPADYLNLKVLDPAVGTGTFLVYALEAITERVLKAWGENHGPVLASVAAIRETLQQAAREQGLACEIDVQAAIRMHIMSSCLYGVDLDLLAVHIAKIALMKNVFRGLPPIAGFEPHVRVGNALIGSASHAWSDQEALEHDRVHSKAYFGSRPSACDTVRQWVAEKKVFHWAHEFPEVFSRPLPGFDCVIGNPPYEIVSVKESGIDDRKLEQKYFRATYRTCQGKINTYRLMMERGLSLLRERGVLGFIVPATLLADSTAEKLRRVMLQETRVIESLVIPETAQAFDRVTQAFLVLVCRKGEKTTTLEPVLWDGATPLPPHPNMVISSDLIERIGYRIPLLRTRREKELLELLMNHPPLGGNGRVPPVCRVHQGEMNLTVARAVITATPTAYPLIRGEHVMPLRVCHPSRQEGRLDWIDPGFVEKERASGSVRTQAGKASALPQPRLPRPWEQDRIVLGRVVNMETGRRLKAAAVSAGRFLGDMTNFIAAPGLPTAYLLGVLNSRVLNWRIKLTSTNNYLSATEVESLPVPRPDMGAVSSKAVAQARQALSALTVSPERSLPEWIAGLKHAVPTTNPQSAEALVAHLVAWIAEEIQSMPAEPSAMRNPTGNLWSALDAAVFLLYGCEEYADVLS